MSKCFCVPLSSGTDEERGLLAWRTMSGEDTPTNQDARMRIYDLPVIQSFLDRVPLFRYIPCCPSFLKVRNATDYDSAGSRVGYDNGLKEGSAHNASYVNPTMAEDKENHTNTRL